MNDLIDLLPKLKAAYLRTFAARKESKEAQERYEAAGKAIKEADDEYESLQYQFLECLRGN